MLWIDGRLPRMLAVLCAIGMSILPTTAWAKSEASTQTLPAAAEIEPHRQAVFSQSLSFSLPTGWKRAYERYESGMYTTEFVPEEESLRQWSSLFCIQGFKGLSADISPEQFLDAMAATYRSSCQGEVIYHKLGPVSVDKYEGFDAILGCTLMPNTHNFKELGLQNVKSKPRSEIGHYTVIGGREDLYLLHKSTRGKVFGVDNPPLIPGGQDKYMAEIQPFLLH